jgi:DNA-directed RNA polymerase subunit RPC12/RpoP
MADRPFGFPPVKNRVSPRQQSSFDEFDATELYCAQCGRAVPVRKSLLLVLPEGDKYEYRCAVCGSTVGDKIDKSGQFYGPIP